MSDVHIFCNSEFEDRSYTYINERLEAVFPKAITVRDRIRQIEPLVPRTPEQRAKLKTHPLFTTD